MWETALNAYVERNHRQKSLAWVPLAWEQQFYSRLYCRAFKSILVYRFKLDKKDFILLGKVKYQGLAKPGLESFAEHMAYSWLGPLCLF